MLLPENEFSYYKDNNNHAYVITSPLHTIFPHYLTNFPEKPSISQATV
jgi:hypothetical protein